jgi:hypothetical protein
MTTALAPRPERVAPATLRIALPTIVVEAGQHAIITSQDDETSLLRPSIRWTENVDEFRDWMSVRGDGFQDGRAAIPHHHLPRSPWLRGATFEREELTLEELEDVKRAAAVYIFGRRQLVADFRTAIEREYAPFAAAFYRAQRIEIEPDAVLTVAGYPAVLELDELTIRRGGNLTLLTPFRLAARVLNAID